MNSLRMQVFIAAFAALLSATAYAGGNVGGYGAYVDPDGRKAELSFDTAPADSLDEVVKSLTRAIDRLARYRVPKEPPNIYRIPHAELEKYVCGTHCSIRAWYRSEDGIYLDESLKPETSLFDRSILLHEMVHYFQDRAGEYAAMGDCERWFHRELDAYTIQNRYLGIIGHPSRVAYSGDNCSNMEAKAKNDQPAQAFDGMRGRVDPDQH